MEPFLRIPLQVFNPHRQRFPMFVSDVNESLFSILEINDFCLHNAAYCVSVLRKIFFVVELLQQKFLKPLVDVACTAELA
jgi:hypothetical protein